MKRPQEKRGDVQLLFSYSLSEIDVRNHGIPTGLSCSCLRSSQNFSLTLRGDLAVELHSGASWIKNGRDKIQLVNVGWEKQKIQHWVSFIDSSCQHKADQSELFVGFFSPFIQMPVKKLRERE